MDRQIVLESIKKIVYECGDIILNTNNDLGIEYKEGNNNVVTKYDVLIQEKLKKELLNIIPDALFIGEENDENKFEDFKYLFIVDPIDGTVNFSRDLHMSAISVALLENNEPIIAVCYNPYINEMYTSIKGEGAYLNGKEIHVSDKKLENGLLLCGSAPYYDELREKSLEVQRKLSMIASDYRRYGSAVIEICNVACGRGEVYFELKLMPWDYAAASLILTEAGGRITTIEGKELEYNNPTSIFASNNKEDYLNYL